MKVLVFGPRGQVGGLLLSAFSGSEIATASRPDTDIRDAAAVRSAIHRADPDAVILAAGLANADYCEDHPDEAYAVNVDGVRHVAEASRGRHFTIFSTDHIFDGKAGPYSEEDRPNPLSVYGRTKLEGERVALAVHDRALVVRTTLVYHLDASGRNFFARLLRTHDPVPCWTDHRATYTYGPNLAEAVAELVGDGRTGIWHLSGPEVLNRQEFALKVARRFGLDESLLRPVSIRQAPPRAPRPLQAGLRTEKALAGLRTKLLSTDEGLELAYRADGRSQPRRDPGLPP